MAVKIVAPLPEKAQLEGEPEPNPSVRFPESPVVMRPSSKVISHTEAQRVMTELHQKGLSKRAIVCEEYKDLVNPENWGIVIDVDPFNEYPLRIHWAYSALRTFSKGDKLTAIYRGMSAQDMFAYLELHKKGVVQ